jgi:hypothetical protein
VYVLIFYKILALKSTISFTQEDEVNDNNEDNDIYAFKHLNDWLKLLIKLVFFHFKNTFVRGGV